MKYAEFRERQQDEVNKLPMYWAFSESQWDKLLKELGLTEENCKEHLTTFAGAIVRKSDLAMIQETFARLDKEKDEAFRDIEFFKDAAVYEMCNHEYSINMQGDWDVINSLGFTVRYSDGSELDECPMSDEQKSAYLEARKEYYRLADEKGWY